MSDSCPCCGVKYNTNQVGVYNISTEQHYHQSEHDFKYMIGSGREIREMCWWCANNLVMGIVDVVYKKRENYNGYTIENFKDYGDLKYRINFINSFKKDISCPRCGGECKEKISENFFSNEKFVVNKCSNPDCGWC